MTKSTILKGASISVTLPLFKNARLVDCNGDLSKRWYVVFYAPTSTGNVKRVRVYDKINNFETSNERRKYAQTLILYINGQLNRGYVIPDEDTQQYEPGLNEWIEKYKDQHINKLRPSSVRVYVSALYPLVEYASIHGIKKIDQLDKHFSIRYRDFLMNKYSNSTTINMYLKVVKALFQFIKERTDNFKSPLDSVKRLKEIREPKQILSQKQACELLAHIKNEDLQIYIICACMYYAFMRPAEICKLKTIDIDMNQNLIHISSSIAKNKQNNTIVITEGLKHCLEYYFEKTSKSELLIVKPIKINTLSHRYNNLSIGYPKHTIYSWKHSGVVHHYINGVGVKFIQQQCRHSSLDMTDKYLRTLKFAENSEMINKAPNLGV